ncbi:MAG: leucyl/phenylalanyl-tRNA--protein transferase [Chloroflexota bacterium]
MPRLPDHLEPNFVLRAYAAGIFPMADHEGRVSWYAPDPRAVLEHQDFRLSRSLRTRIRRGEFAICVDTAFEAVMRACAAPRHDDPGTWISEEFIEVYTLLHRHGFAHSVEAWRDGKLVGGLYGVSIGGAFMGESMFSRATDASKICLAGLVERLQVRGFTLHDVQFLTPHLQRMGAREIRRADYERRLGAAVGMNCTFGR